jgi:hypothetical protein
MASKKLGFTMSGNTLRKIRESGSNSFMDSSKCTTHPYWCVVSPQRK